MASDESTDVTIVRLRVELAAALERAQAAETQLLEVHQAVRAFREKRELVAQTLRDQEAKDAGEQRNASAAPVPESPSSTFNSSMSTASWEEPDPSLDERLTKYLNKDFEPDRSRKWMLE